MNSLDLVEKTIVEESDYLWEVFKQTYNDEVVEHLYIENGDGDITINEFEKGLYYEWKEEYTGK